MFLSTNCFFGFMKSKEIKEYVEEKGYLHLSVLFEVVGNPKEHVESMLKKVMEGVKSNKGVIVFKEDYGAPEDAGENLWGTFCEAELLIKNVDLISWVAFNFSPASIEIKAPKKITLTDKNLNSLSGEMLSALHQNNMNLMRIKSESKEILLNFNTLARNAILLSLKDGAKLPADVARSVGIDDKSTVKFLDAMVKEKTVDKQGDEYVRIK